MSLCRVYEWQNIKTVKLSDAYDVKIKVNDDTTFVKLPECTNATLPSYKYKEEIYKYGNNEKKYLIPDYTGLEDLSLEFMENYREDSKDFAFLRIQDLVNIFLNKLFDSRTFGYKLFDYISEIVVTVYKNNFSDAVLEYVFKNLKLTDYTKYELDYSSGDIAKWTLKFSYQEYYVNYFVADKKPPKKEKETKNDMYAAQYNAMMEARGQMYKGGRGIRTPREDQVMAKKYEDSLNKGESALDEAISEKKIERQKKLNELSSLESMNNKPVSTFAEHKKLEEAREKVAAAEAALEAAEVDLDIKTKKHAEASAEHASAVKNAEETVANENSFHAMVTDNNAVKEAKAQEAGAAKRRSEAFNSKVEQEKAVEAAKKALEEAKLAEEEALGTYNLKASQNIDVVDRQKRIAQLKSEINTINSEIVNLNNEKTEQVTVAQEQQQRFLQERNSMSSEQKLRNARYQDTAEHAIKSNESESVRESWSNDASTEIDSDIHSLNRQQMKGEDGFIKNNIEGKQKQFYDRQERRSDAEKEALEIAEQAAIRPELAELEELEESPVVEQAPAKKIEVTKTKTDAGELIDIKNSENVYSHPDFQERVTALSMEMYKPGKSDPQMVYEKAQAKAMQEYLEGKLKLK